MTREQWIRRKAALALGVVIKIARGACIVVGIYVAVLILTALTLPWYANGTFPH